MARLTLPSLPRLALLALAAIAACEGAQVYVYSAQKYDPAADCVATYAPVETVSGSGTSSTCPPMCLSVGSDIFVSTMCPPFPSIATPVPPDAGPCIAALAAAESGGTCDTPAEAGAEADAGEDAAIEPDAEADASEADADAADTGSPVVDASDAG
jgi:hypothetical protein